MPYRIQNSDIDKASQVLGRSFIDYPIFKYVFPDDQYRKKKLCYLFSFLIKLGILNGEVYASSKNMEAVSIWFNSSSNKLTLMSALKAGIISLSLKVDSKAVKRFRDIGLTKQNIRADIVHGKYDLLDVIGVDPSFQNKGFARFLIESKLNNTKNIKTPCYLETSNLDNIKFYNKFDFNLIHEYELEKIKVFCLYRKSF
jgi:hypothetical protein